MTLELLRTILGWCALIDMLLLTLWLLIFTLAHDWMHRLHGRLFQLSQEQFDAIHYAGMALLKMATLVFFLVPYLVLRLAI